MRRRGILALYVVATLAACETVPTAELAPVPVPGHPGVTYMPVQRMVGNIRLGFELQTFNGCWFGMTSEAYAQLQRHAPESNGRGPYQYRVAMMGRSTSPAESESTAYGHLGMYPCQVQATRFISIERVRFRL